MLFKINKPNKNKKRSFNQTISLPI